jgi:hypothetical protein
MTVAELIAHLQKCEPTDEVYWKQWDGDWTDNYEIETISTFVPGYVELIGSRKNY